LIAPDAGVVIVYKDINLVFNQKTPKTNTFTVLDQFWLFCYNTAYLPGVVMNDRDQTNLEFLLNISDEDFQQFVNDSDLDDVTYAIQLIQTYCAEVQVREMELQDALETELGLDCTQARAVLAKFQL
jgi:hypothetical protein